MKEEKERQTERQKNRVQLLHKKALLMESLLLGTREDG